MRIFRKPLKISGFKPHRRGSDCHRWGFKDSASGFCIPGVGAQTPAAGVRIAGVGVEDARLWGVATPTAGVSLPLVGEKSPVAGVPTAGAGTPNPGFLKAGDYRSPKALPRRLSATALLPFFRPEGADGALPFVGEDLVAGIGRVDAVPDPVGRGGAVGGFVGG